MEPLVNISEYNYELPPDRIAEFPLQDRDESNLLVYRQGKIEHTLFRFLPDFLPVNATLFFNDTRVIPARIFFVKHTGATIEVLLLTPVMPSPLLAETMSAKGECVWECTVGNLKRWKAGSALQLATDGISLTAELIDRDTGIIRFAWSPGELSFAEVLLKAGVTPLPPYIRRNTTEEDAQRYQTVYAQREGAVAAPTAGLHFTENVLHTLQERGAKIDFLTLHVSAGTFQPIKTEDATKHTMHREQLVVTHRNLEHLLKPDRAVVAVGTTTMRTLESLYWYGLKLMEDPDAEFLVTQFDPHENIGRTATVSAAMEAVLLAMERRKVKSLTGHTSIYIYPGYSFKVCKGLVTNFHLPGSTLMLLVAAFAGPDWKKIYAEALANNYRFLSYGDSSLLLP